MPFLADFTGGWVAERNVMAEEPTQVEEQKQPKEAKEQPKEKPKPSPQRSAAEIEEQSRKDREVVEARKEARTAREEAEKLRHQMEQNSGYITLLKERGELSDNEEARLKRVAEREAQLSSREETLTQAERRAAVRLLQAEYGVPANVLDEYDDPREMEIAALKWERDHRTAPDEEPKPKAKEPDDEPPPKQTDFDHGSGGRTGWKEYSPSDLKDPEKRKEIEAELDRRDQEARRRMARR